MRSVCLVVLKELKLDWMFGPAGCGTSIAFRVDPEFEFMVPRWLQSVLVGTLDSDFLIACSETASPKYTAQSGRNVFRAVSEAVRNSVLTWRQNSQNWWTLSISFYFYLPIYSFTSPTDLLFKINGLRGRGGTEVWTRK